MTRPWLSVRPRTVGTGEAIGETETMLNVKAILFSPNLRGPNSRHPRATKNHAGL